jgi:hypothetical protein
MTLGIRVGYQQSFQDLSSVGTPRNHLDSKELLAQVVGSIRHGHVPGYQERMWHF